MTDAVPAELFKRPQSCYEKFTPSTGSTLFSYNKPTANISLFDESSPVFQKYLTKLTNIIYEASIEGYERPNTECLKAFIISHSIVDKQKLGIHSITPISEGGIAYDIHYNGSYIHIQFDNDGDAAIYLEDSEGTPKGWDMNFNKSFTKLKELLS